MSYWILKLIVKTMLHVVTYFFLNINSRRRYFNTIIVKLALYLSNRKKLYSTVIISVAEYFLQETSYKIF